MTQEQRFKVGDKVLCRTTLLNDKPKLVYKIRAVTEDGRYLIVNERQNGSFAWFRDDELEPYTEPKKDKDMIVQEDYCSFELSKLLKEKGFDFENQSEGIKELLSLEYNEVYFTITHALAMKWLREVHKIDIFIDTDFPIDKMKYTYKIVRIYKDGDKYTDVMGGSFDTYEGAVEAALKYCLTKLI